MIYKILPSKTEIENTINNFNREIPTLKVDFIDFIGYRYDANKILINMFQLISKFRVYGFFIGYSFEDDDLAFISNNDYNKNNFTVATDSDSIVVFTPTGNIPVLVDYDKYSHIEILVISNNDGNRKIVFTLNQYILYEYVSTCAKLHRNFDKHTMSKIQSIKSIIDIPSCDFIIKRIFVPKVLLAEELTTICILLSIGDMSIIYTCSVKTSALNKKILKQSIISRNFDLLDEVYKSSCTQYDNSITCFIASSIEVTRMSYYTLENDAQILHDNTVLITEYDDYHEPTAICLDRDFLINLQSSININYNINSPIY